ncbi:MAG: hypothetical protein ACT4OL_03465 [Nitrospiraceae bacterium]
MNAQEQERVRKSNIEAVMVYLQQAFPNTIVETRSENDAFGTIFYVNDSEGRLLHRTTFTRTLLDDTHDPSQLIAQLLRWELISQMKKAGTSFVRVGDRGIYRITESI